MVEKMSCTRQDQSFSPPGIDITRPSAARVYDAVLGGRDNYPVDREPTAQVVAAFPGKGTVINRAMLGRAVCHTIGGGIDQFPDPGSGLPMAQHTHGTVRSADPQSRVVHAGNDPIVPAHGNALPASNRPTAVVAGGHREPERVFSGVSDALDLRRPRADQECGDTARPRRGGPGRRRQQVQEDAGARQLSAAHPLLPLHPGGPPAGVGAGAGTRPRPAPLDGPDRRLLRRAGDPRTGRGVVHLPYRRPDEPAAAPLDIGGLFCGGGLGRKPGGEG